MAYGPFTMIPMVTERGVDRSRPGWDTGLMNFGYTEDERFPEVPLTARTLKRAKAEALGLWEKLKASTQNPPEGFMLVGPPGVLMRHYIDDGEYTGWSFRERDRREEIEFTIENFDIASTGKRLWREYLVPAPPEGLHPSQLGLNPEEDEVGGKYMLEIRDDEGIVFTSAVHVSWGQPETNPKAMMGDDLVLQLKFEEPGRVLEELLRLKGRKVTLRFDYQGV